MYPTRNEGVNNGRKRHLKVILDPNDSTDRDFLSHCEAPVRGFFTFWNFPQGRCTRGVSNFTQNVENLQMNLPLGIEFVSV